MKAFLVFFILFSIIDAFTISDGNLHQIDSIIKNSTPRDNPPEGLEIVTPAEFSHCDGVLISYVNWSNNLLHDIALAIADRYPVYILIEDLVTQQIAYDNLQTAGVNMDNVYFILFDLISSGSIWIRDSGPFYIYEDGLPAIVDYYYGIYPGDDSIPEYCADYFTYPRYESSVLHHGGNHISDGNGMAFVTSNITEYNNETLPEIKENFKTYMGVDSLVVIPSMENDGTGHIDMFCKLLTDTTFIVGYYENPEDGWSNNQQILDENAVTLDSMTNLYGDDFEVVRIYMPPFVLDGPNGKITYTYTNSLLINDKVLVPVYGFDTDARALQVYESILPNHEVIGIDSADIIEWWGAVHCVTQLHYGENPLVIFHEPIYEINSNEEYILRFRSNPKFDEMYGKFYYRTVGETQFQMIPAIQNQGFWEVTLPNFLQDFEYYLSVSTHSINNSITITYPQNAPEDCFDVTVINSSFNQEIVSVVEDLKAFPNPSYFGEKKNTDFTIEFNLKKTENIKIEIYNCKGQCIEQMNYLNCKSGKNIFLWDGKDRNNQNVNTGVYLYRIKSAEQEFTGKFILFN